MRLIIAGFGTVGQGLAELILEKTEELKEDYGMTLEVVGIADMLKGSIVDSEGIDLKAALEAVKSRETLNGIGHPFEGTALEMISSLDADALCEATYTDLKTGEPATSHIRAALKRGMHVTTTNKGPVALAYRELARLAWENKARFLFEGTVMSGTPLLNLLRETLAGCRIDGVMGILNGTTNFILTRMEEGLDYDTALAEAQERGYAEAVPDADVLGHDALAKVTILANVVFGASLHPSDTPCEGITGITPEMIRDASARGKRYRLIGRVERSGDDVRASVAPMEIDQSHPLAGVSGATNAATISTDALGEITIVGPGAGRRETGYALLIDLIRIGGAS